MKRGKHADRGGRGATGRRSMRMRLILFFVVLLGSSWMIAAVFSWRECRIHIDEFFDTQQLLFARQLASADFSRLSAEEPLDERVFDAENQQSAMLEEDAIGFAVFCRRGRVLLSDGKKGDGFIFDENANGFINSKTSDSEEVWRIAWIPSNDEKRVIAVGQRLGYRTHVAFRMLVNQFIPWLVMLPVLLGGFLWLLNRELMPLRDTAERLSTRRPRDTSPLPYGSTPEEVRPLIKSLNSLFARISAMLARERAFISDAAHELRTPLTALRIHADVVALSDDDRNARDKALKGLRNGIDRCGRLIEQLLTLSRIEAMQDCGEDESAAKDLSIVDWAALLTDAETEFAQMAGQKKLSVILEIRSEPQNVMGYPALSSILLRNLLDNAAKYTPEEGRIRLTLTKRWIKIENSGTGVREEYIDRLSERFFRPPGQRASGSGLGLSIARRIAFLQKMRLTLRNKYGRAGEPNGFMAVLTFRPGGYEVEKEQATDPAAPGDVPFRAASAAQSP